MKKWTGANEGEKIVPYGDTGLGKTTLCSMMPNPVFIGLDEGGRRIINPKTQEPINHVPGIETFEDVRAALNQFNLWPRGGSCVIDTFTLLEQLAEKHTLETVPLPKGGGQARNIKSYGWNDGSSHVLDAVRLVLQDLDALIHQGVNVGLVCQEQNITIANPEGKDYLQACPKLHHDRQYSVMLEVCAWADQVFRIGYYDVAVFAEKDRKVGKVTTRSTQRAIYVQGAQYFRAKSRTQNRFVSAEGELVDIVAFDHPADDSIWQFIFPQE